MMYGIITCSGCGKNRIIDLSDDVTACPYCNTKCETKNSVVLFSDFDQSTVRKMFESMTGFSGIEDKKDVGGIDPLSTLAYKVEHTPDIGEKMNLISTGLTDILGSFTVDDVDELVPGKGKQYVGAMLNACMIYETEYGRYRV
jgi:DNA-directed RNA polymerase subunit RPC12/RpoP